MAIRYQTLNADANASEVDPTNKVLAGSTSESRQQLANKLSADNSLPTTPANPGPANISLEYDCNLTTGSILIKGDVPNGTKLAITAVSGNTLLLANAQNAVLDGGTPYGFGPYNNTYASGIYNAQWAFGPRNLVSGSGITGERLMITLTDASGKWLLDVSFTPKTITGRVLCRRTALGTPTSTPSHTDDPAATPTPTPTPTPTVSQIPTSTMGLDVVGTYSTNNGGTLQLRAHGATDTNYQLKIESLGSPFTLSNSQNSSIPYNQFVGWGASGDASFPMDWTFWGVTPGQQVRLTFTRNGSTEVIPVFIPSTGSKVLLRTSGSTVTVPSTGTGTATTTTTTTATISIGGVLYALDRGLVVGNSITHHPGVPGEWDHSYGMDAADQAHDYWHLYWDNLKTINSAFQFKECLDITGNITDGPYFESDYDRLDGGMARFQALANYKPNLALFRLGENIDENGVVSRGFVDYYKQLIRLTVSQNQQCLIILTNSVWPGKSAVNAAIATVYNALKDQGYNIIFVDVTGIVGATSGYENHPNAAAHVTIASKLWAATPHAIGAGGTGTATVTATQTTTTTTGNGTTTVVVPAFNQSVSYANATKSSFISADGGTHMDTFITSADYADFSLTGVPFSASNYDCEITYQTNWANGSGEGSVVVNGVTKSFPLVGAEGGTRRYTVSIPLNQGNNTVRVRGGSNVFQYPSISVSRSASTETVTGGGTNTQATQTQATQTTATATATQTTNGSGTGSSDPDFIAGAFDFADLPQVSIPSDYLASLETDKLKVTLDLREGVAPNKGLAGGIRYFTDKTTGNNTLNIPVFQQGSGGDYGFPLGTVNDGRGINECLYRLPAPWTLNGKVLGIGDNVNETGDGTETPSRLIAFRRDSNTLQTVIEPNQWDGEGLRTGDVFKKWIKVNGNEMRVWFESNFNRTDSTGKNERQESKVQEAPCNYLNGNYSTICFYDGDAPYTNAPHRTFRLEDNSGMTPGATFMTENWIAGMDPATGRCQGMILETPATQIGQFQSKGSYNAEGNLLSSTYIAYYPFQLLDYNIKWRHSVIFVVGTLEEIRQKAYLYTSWKRTLEVRFNKRGRQNWGGRWFDDGGHKESRSTWGPITWTSNEGEIVTPAVALDGSIKKMYMRYKYTSQSRQNVNMVARWTRARQAAGYTNGTALWNERFPEGAAVGDDYAKTYSLIADGQWHVKEIDFSDKAQWRQIITQVRFCNDGQSAVGESLEVEWFSGSVNGPSQIVTN